MSTTTRQNSQSTASHRAGSSRQSQSRLLSKKRLNKPPTEQHKISTDVKQPTNYIDRTAANQAFGSEAKKTSPTTNDSKLDADDIKSLSNTHVFDRNREPISSDANKNIRKSMNSIKVADNMQPNSYTADVRK